MSVWGRKIRQGRQYKDGICNFYRMKTDVFTQDEDLKDAKSQLAAIWGKNAPGAALEILVLTSAWQTKVQLKAKSSKSSSECWGEGKPQLVGQGTPSVVRGYLELPTPIQGPVSTHP